MSALGNLAAYVGLIVTAVGVGLAVWVAYQVVMELLHRWDRKDAP